MTKVLLIDEFVLPKTGQHRLTKPKVLFPFSSQHHATYLKNNFKLVISELARNVTRYNLDNSALENMSQYYENANPLSEYIGSSNKIEFNNDVDRVNFIRFIDSYLFNRDNQMKIIHTYLYNFIGESEAGQIVIRNIAEFINSIFIGEDEELQNIFKNKETDDLLTKIIVEEIESLVSGKKKDTKAKYANVLPDFVKLFKEDLKFLVKHKDFFVANFEAFMNYYVFMYFCQTVLQFEKLSKASGDVQPIYFALDWEAVTKKRAVASYLHGYKFIKEHAPNLFIHEFVLRFLSHNFFNEHAEQELEVYSYSKLLAEVESHGEQYTKQFIIDLQQAIQTYSDWAGLGKVDTSSQHIDELLSQLLKLVESKVSKDVMARYATALDSLAFETFLKQRGSLGYLLNIQHSFLMLMTAVIVKDERMPFKDLLKEFEKRGIAFDRHSIEEIVTLFDNHNILDKKSDSGDAQYVKPIL
ncbi:DNA phosphorothioation-dependent restriction protein DptG [Caryophanon latum]|uniref:DNA phosphorothioation-dependent restriction protein DptG n=1 Tax=Caryophanon latum TaxID=33977 RepID=A0A1C0YJE6_9BACL|nr:DNA phosphorothioation-dependent restriction protein DptG [Caryophanon latum]OCS87290.1 DNA phosphorothioation-dependent restriction protein DptG [Caryophanon latum]